MNWFVLLNTLLTNSIPLIGVFYFRWEWNSVFQFYIVEFYVITLFDTIRFKFAKDTTGFLSGRQVDELDVSVYLIIVLVAPSVLLLAMPAIIDTVQLKPWSEFYFPAAILIFIHGLRLMRLIFIQRTTEFESIGDIFNFGFMRMVVVVGTLFLSPFVVRAYPSWGLNGVIVTMVGVTLILEVLYATRIEKNKKISGS